MKIIEDSFILYRNFFEIDAYFLQNVHFPLIFLQVIMFVKMCGYMHAKDKL